MAITCPNCNAELPDDAVFCDQCGSSLGSSISPPVAAAAIIPAAAGENICPQCGASTIPGEAFCDNCGASLGEPQIAVPAPAPEPVAVPTPVQSGLVQCPDCGTDNLPGSKFCSNCGILMQEPAVEEEPEPAVEPQVEEPVELEPVVEEELIEEAGPVAEAEPVEEAEPAAVAEPPTPTGQPRFIVRDTGTEILLPTTEGDHIIGREDPVSGVFPEIDMNPHQGEHFGVSRRHAQLTIEAGLIFIQDLDSTNFSFVDRKKLDPHKPIALSNGDEVRLGKLVMTFLE